MHASNLASSVSALSMGACDHVIQSGEGVAVEDMESRDHEHRHSTAGASEFSSIRSTSIAAIILTLASVASVHANPRSLVPSSLLSQPTRPNNQVTRCQNSPFAPAVETRVSRLAYCLEAEQAEDGVSHPAEQAAIDLIESGNGNYLLDYAIASISRGHFNAAALLRILGRVREVDGDSRVALVSQGLLSGLLGVRDAAIQAAEQWGDSRLVTTLQSHKEDVPWLAEYLSHVIDDISA